MKISNLNEVKKKLEIVIKNIKDNPVPYELYNQRIKIEDHILKSMSRGVSPVEGLGRYTDYSDAYKNAIGGKYKNSLGKIVTSRFNLGKEFGKRVRPVNLFLSGDMYDSLATHINRNGFVIRFKSKLAYIHDRLGAGKKKVIRRILPTGNETFSKTITNGLINAVKQYINRITKFQ